MTITAIIAASQLVAIHDQVASARKQTGMDNLWRIHEQLVSPEMQEKLHLLRDIEKPVSAEVLLSGDERADCLISLLNFYELLALNVNRGYIEFEDIAGYVGSDVIEFWEGVDQAVEEIRRREKRHTLFQELEEFYRRLRTKKTQ